ncbi:polysaccharide biosynthesis/export family protein [Solirubrum puertoriconensis]|nr:polysaccharide biosynthesis/export family protein [Solirubrum puertoriconensis]
MLTLLGSCASSRRYQQSIMFRPTKRDSADTLMIRGALSQVQGTYRIKPNDYLEVRVFTNEGERLIDPNGELGFGSPGAQSGGVGSANRQQRVLTTRGGGGGAAPAPTDYLVGPDGRVVLPVIEPVRVAGLTARQADSLLQTLYDKFYRGVFVQTRVTNHRVVVLGTPGGQIVPLTNENMSLIEVIAAVGGPNNTGGVASAIGGKLNNIRLIRPEASGSFKRAQVQVIDLTTIAGMRQANLKVQPNDVIYIEPARRSAFIQGLQDAAPLIGLLGTITALVSTSVFIIDRL